MYAYVYIATIGGMYYFRLYVRILVLFYYTVNLTTYSSKVDYTILTLVPRQDTTL